MDAAIENALRACNRILPYVINMHATRHE
jgi:hypothetical protein